ncbi:histidine kinase [Psychrobacter aestuarii]|uniref:Signal transduction histidine kinase internal region domain-containing protein n=1 Tax=Psychrobacter aestuarii TaxID=556327 RepID=A0ABN0W2Y4_9GAMM|nr:sensor histidine kinase [Psychrobacter aestuarii]
MMSPWQWLLYLFFWSLFVTVIDRHDLDTWMQFLTRFSGRVVKNVLTVIPAAYLIDYLRPTFKHMSSIKASLSVLFIFTLSSAFWVTVVMLMMINLGLMVYDRADFILNVCLMMVITGGFAFVFLLYFMRRHREMMALKQSFEQKLAAQNDLIKARIAPHFFFNTINSLNSLIESDPPKAAELLQDISALFRASFSGIHEISFEEEIALCEHYLAIESSRLSEKLVVHWQLPDDEVMYDMVITALTLQGVLEKMLSNVVEVTTETIVIDIKAVWEQHHVRVTVTVTLPNKTFIVLHDLRQRLDFRIQAERLQAYFGETADITSTVNRENIVTSIHYPLQDVGL